MVFILVADTAPLPSWEVGPVLTWLVVNLSIFGQFGEFPEGKWYVIANMRTQIVSLCFPIANFFLHWSFQFGTGSEVSFSESRKS